MKGTIPIYFHSILVEYVEGLEASCAWKLGITGGGFWTVA